MNTRMEIIRCNPNPMWGRNYWKCVAINAYQNTRLEFLSLHFVELHTFITVEIKEELANGN